MFNIPEDSSDMHMLKLPTMPPTKVQITLPLPRILCAQQKLYVLILTLPYIQKILVEYITTATFILYNSYFL